MQVIIFLSHSIVIQYFKKGRYGIFLERQNWLLNFHLSDFIRSALGMGLESCSPFVTSAQAICSTINGAQACSWHLRRSNHYCTTYLEDFRWERHPTNIVIYIYMLIFCWIIYVLNLLTQSRCVELVMFHCIPATVFSLAWTKCIHSFIMSVLPLIVSTFRYE